MFIFNIMDSSGTKTSCLEDKGRCDSVENEQNLNNIDCDEVAVNTTETETSDASAERDSLSAPDICKRDRSRSKSRSRSNSPPSQLETTRAPSSMKSNEQSLERVFSNGPVFPARHNGELMSPAYGHNRDGDSPSVNSRSNQINEEKSEVKGKISFDYDVDLDLGVGENEESSLCPNPLGLNGKSHIHNNSDTELSARITNLTNASENESLAPLSASLFNCQYQTPSWIDDPLIGVPPSAMENKNTHRKTGADMRILTAYMRSLNELRLPEAIPPDELDKYLSSFFLVVRKADGSEYEPCSLRAMLASIERYLRFKNYPLSLTRDSAFSNMRNVLKLKQQTLRSIGKGQKNQSEVTPSSLAREGKIAHLFKSQEMGPYTPSSLVFTLCFYFCMYLRLRKSTENKKLLWGDIVLCKDDSGREFLTFSSQMLRRTQGSSKLNLKQRSYRIWADPSCPEKDPVTIYKFYEQKRPVSMNTNMAPFYLGINVLYPTQGQLWYRPAAMGINKLNEMVRQIRDMTGIRSTSDFHGDIVISDKGSEGEGSTQGEQSPSSESADRQEFDNEIKQEIVDEPEDENDTLDRNRDQIEPPLDCSQNIDRMQAAPPPLDFSSARGTPYSDGESNDSFTPQSFPSSSQAGSATGEIDTGHEVDLSNSVNSPLNCTTNTRNHHPTVVNGGVFNPIPAIRSSDEFLSLAEAKEQLINLVKKLEASDVIHFDGWLKKVTFQPDISSDQIICKESDETMKVNAWSKPSKQGANITLNISLSHEALKGEGPITVTAQSIDGSPEHPSNSSNKPNPQAPWLSTSTAIAKTMPFTSSTTISSPLNTSSIDKPLDLATNPLTKGHKSSSSSSQQHKSHRSQGANGIFPSLSSQSGLDQPMAKRLRLSAEQAEAYTNASLLAGLSSTNLVNERLRMQLMQAGFRTGDYGLDAHSQSLLDLASSEAFRSQLLQHYGIKTEPK